MRKRNHLVYSMEQLFEDIRNEMPADISVEAHEDIYPSLGVWKRLFSILDAALHQADVNHVTGDVHFLNLLMRRKATILTIHDCVTLERLAGLKYMVYRFFWYWLPARKSSVITVISSSTKTELERHLGKGDWPIRVIPNPVSPAYVFSAKPFSTCPRVLQVGTKPNKNLERVASALRGLDCHLVVVGKLSSSQICVLESNSIEYENHIGLSRHGLVKQYQQSDILAFCSLYEGFGLPILEAQAVGRPVITSNLYSMPEVGGDGAYYVNPYDIEELQAAFKRLFVDKELRQKLVLAGLENVEKYSISRIANIYAEVYRNVYESSDPKW